ncbi:MAG: hypothetical protein AAF688_08040 [Bacteroidota bacterium]
MGFQFSRVGQKTTNLEETFSLGELKKQYSNFVEEAYNIMQSDMGLSDILYYEAYRLKCQILNLEKASLKAPDAKS